MDATTSGKEQIGCCAIAKNLRKNIYVLFCFVYRDQIVGWPPVRCYRRQTLARPVETFVKVNMDGITVGRKVDLNAYTSYEGLLGALEEMFRPSSNGNIYVLSSSLSQSLVTQILMLYHQCNG